MGGLVVSPLLSRSCTLHDAFVLLLQSGRKRIGSNFAALSTRLPFLPSLQASHPYALKYGAKVNC